MPHGTVYFIRSPNGRGPVKIGISAQPDERRKALQRSVGRPLVIAATYGWSFGSAVERSFHAMFRDLHIGGEWFEQDAALEAAIDALAAGSFDATQLPPPRRLWSGKGRQKVAA